MKVINHPTGKVVNYSSAAKCIEALLQENVRVSN